MDHEHVHFFPPPQLGMTWAAAFFLVFYRFAGLDSADDYCAALGRHFGHSGHYDCTQYSMDYANLACTWPDDICGHWKSSEFGLRM